MAGRSGTPLQRRAEEEALLTGISQAQASRRAAPTRIVSGPGVIPGRTLDPLAMSALQRQLFLPKTSQEIPNYHEAMLRG